MSRAVIVAVDPGEKRSAFVVAAPLVGGKITIVRAEMVDADCVAMATFLEETARRDDIAAVAIEWASGFAYNAFRVPNLLASQGIAGEASGLAHARALPVHKVSAPTWRAAVVGKLPRPKKAPKGVKVAKPKYDALIARALPTFVDGLDVSNPHTRDATGVAVWLARIVFRRVA